MAGKKGRSGPPGNLNNVQNPWRSFWARKALRQQDKWILPALRHYLDEAIEDAGGDDISSGRSSGLDPFASDRFEIYTSLLQGRTGYHGPAGS